MTSEMRAFRRLHSSASPRDDDDGLASYLARAGRGDQQAFADLYDHLAPLVHGIVLKVVRDPSQSEEVTQEVFVEMWRLAARYEPSKGSVRTWAATLAHRRAIDRVRSEQATRNRQDREANKRIVEVPSPSPSRSPWTKLGSAGRCQI